jgi:hypothetical protein
MMVDVLTEMRKINFARNYAWEILFTAAPSPFTEFFPAISYAIGLGTSTLLDIPTAITSFKVPHASAPETFTFSCYDNESGTLTTWLSDWFKLLTADNYVRALKDDEVARQVKVRTLSYGDRVTRISSVLHTRSFWVIPEGKFDVGGGSEEKFTTITASFAIVGEDTE